MTKSTRQPATAPTRLVIAALFGLAAGSGCYAILGRPVIAGLVAWDAAALLYVAWVWLAIFPLDAASTKVHAVQENPGRALADVILLASSVVSLLAVGLLILHASNSTGQVRAVDIGLGLASVIVSWAVVHTTYALKYARLYYGDPEGGIDFNSEAVNPRYSDFAYLAFTIGMTFQVSDTAIKTNEIRVTALKHALLAFIFGTVIIATTINTLASLSS